VRMDRACDNKDSPYSIERWLKYRRFIMRVYYHISVTIYPVGLVKPRTTIMYPWVLVILYIKSKNTKKICVICIIFLEYICHIEYN